MQFPAVFFGTLREHYLVLFGAAGGVALLAGFIGAWVGSFLGARTAARLALKGARDELAPTRQIENITQALDVLTLEVERMSEGHRFIAKLLAERAQHELLPPSPRDSLKSMHNTPH